ncbi:MAG TPA: hypothetical protein VMB52_04225 [Verrucomicrobiae bacterium]|nr:hypothetical protein [Verrucomicrobiae bacterium]
MKFILLGIFVFFFVGMPLYLLNTVVMPEVSGLAKSYAGQGQAVEAMFPERSH